MRFVFSDESGSKRRPTLVLSTSDYHPGRQEAIVLAITSNVQRMLIGDHMIEGWREAGLLFPSVATGIIRTVKQAMVVRRLGQMPAADMQTIEDKVRHVLGL